MNEILRILWEKGLVNEILRIYNKELHFEDDMEEFFILCFESKRQKLKSKIR